MAESLNGQYFEHNVLSLHFESFNQECVTIKGRYDRYLLSQKTKLKTVRLLLNWFPLKYKKAVITITLINFTALDILGHTESFLEFGKQWKLSLCHP